ncbi:MAG: hypothetical protein QOD71_3579 [Thermoleophilaceae bacterium]|nr:hypothetical protein [Thermoleophilaceae bacterium]
MLWKRDAPGRASPPPRARRLRRRTMAPSRPALYPDQIGLFVLTLAALGAGIYAALRFLL